MPNPLPFPASPIPYVLLSCHCSLLSIPYSFRGKLQNSYFNSHTCPSHETRHSSLIPPHKSFVFYNLPKKCTKIPPPLLATSHSYLVHHTLFTSYFLRFTLSSSIRFSSKTNKTNTSPHICRSIGKYGTKHPQIWGVIRFRFLFFQKRIPSSRLNHSTPPFLVPHFSSLITRIPIPTLFDYQTIRQ